MSVDDLGDVVANPFEACRSREILALKLSQPGLYLGQDGRLVRSEPRERLFGEFQTAASCR
jgi:hypothetical protein